MAKKYKDFLITLEKLAKVVYKELGDGFDEDDELFENGTG